METEKRKQQKLAATRRWYKRHFAEYSNRPHFCAKCKVSLQKGLNWAPSGSSPYCRPCASAIHKEWRIKQGLPFIERAKQFNRTDKRRFTNVKSWSKSSGNTFSLSLEQCSAAWKLSCFYCDGPLPEMGRGLDRLDNDKGYEIDNVVPCCAECNYMRGDWLSPRETLILAQVRNRIRAGTFELHNGLRPR